MFGIDTVWDERWYTGCRLVSLILLVMARWSDPRSETICWQMALPPSKIIGEMPGSRVVERRRGVERGWVGVHVGRFQQWATPLSGRDRKLIIGIPRRGESP